MSQTQFGVLSHIMDKHYDLTRHNLQELLDELEQRTGRKPVIGWMARHKAMEFEQWSRSEIQPPSAKEIYNKGLQPVSAATILQVPFVFTIAGPEDEGFVMGELDVSEQERLASMAVAYSHVQRYTGQKDQLLDRGYICMYDIEDDELREALHTYNKKKTKE